MSTPITDSEYETQKREYDMMAEIDWPPFYADFDFARKLEVQLNAALNEIGELRKVIVELTAAGNCVEGDKMNLAMAIREVGGTANVKWSTDNWNKAKDWDRRNK